MVASIENLPIEVMVHIFEHLSLNEIQNVTLAYPKWQETAAHFFIQPYICQIAELNVQDLKNSLETENWSDDCQDFHLIMSLFEKFKYRYGMYFRGAGQFCSQTIYQVNKS